MATITQGHVPTRVSASRGWFAGMLSEVRRWRMERRTFDALAELSDRELDDLGIKRWQLRDVARRAVAGA